MQKNHFLLPLSFALISLILPGSSANADEEANKFKEYLEQANSYIKAYRHFEAGEALRQATALGGDKHPSLHMRLGILYYGLGSLAEAILEAEKAVELTPSSKWYRYDLAKFYYVDKQYQAAREQLISLLQLDPGFTLGYYYLGEVALIDGQPELAWYCLERARQLGHQSRLLADKLAAYKKPASPPPASPQAGLFRFIKFDSEEAAQSAMAQIAGGMLFENLELELKTATQEGADFGLMTSGELKPEVALLLENLEPFSQPTLIRTGPDFRLMQRILPFVASGWVQAVPAVTAAPQNDTASSPSALTHSVVSTETAGDSQAGQFSSRLAAFYALEAWKQAWQSADSEAYLAAYSADFRPADQMSLPLWREKRRQALAKPRTIQVRIEEPVVEMSGTDQAAISFVQLYRSDYYRDKVRKTLTLNKEAEGWKIVREEVIEELAP